MGQKTNAIQNQGEARNIRNQGFYQSTVQALEAKKLAKNPTENGGLSPVPGQDQKPAGDDIARPVPPRKNEAEGSSDQDDEVEIPIAGRTKMKIPKPKSKQEQEHGQEQEQGGDEYRAAKAELNSILKRAPGMCLLSLRVRAGRSQLTGACSHHLLQILLPLQRPR